jgi:hypothetical protein
MSTKILRHEPFSLLMLTLIGFLAGCGGQSLQPGTNTVLAGDNFTNGVSTPTPAAGTPPTTTPPTTPPSAIVTAVSVPAVTAFSVTPENTHAVVPTPLTTGYTRRGNWADCGLARCNGNQYLDAKSLLIAPTDTTPVATSFYISPENAHINGGPGIPFGSQLLGSLADCGGGNCGGNQLVAATFQPWTNVPKGAVYLQDVTVTNGTHTVGGQSCPNGYSSAGTIADCSGGNCSGNQKFCVKYAIK